MSGRGTSRTRVIGSGLRRALLASAVVLGAGTLGFVWTEGWGLWESFFVTLITITTVGYGDHGMTRGGEVIAAFMMVGGIGLVTYTVSQVIQASIEASLNKEHRMSMVIDRMRDHVIVCGLGRIGRFVCRELSQAGTPFVAIDDDESTVAEAREHGWVAMHGDVSEDEVLSRAGIERASSLVCALSSDTVNIVTTLTARDMRPGLRIISRADSPEAVRKIQRAGATEAISPVWVGAKRIAYALTNPDSSTLLVGEDPTKSTVQVRERRVLPGDGLDGRCARDFGETHTGIIFLAVQTPDGSTKVRPGVGHTLRAGELLIFAGELDALEAFQSAITAPAAAA